MKFRRMRYLCIIPSLLVISGCEVAGAGASSGGGGKPSGGADNASMVNGPVPDSGQTACYYDVTLDGIYNPESYTCLAPGSAWGPDGQDGYYTLNAMSLSDNSDGTILDNVTGLTWQKCTMGESGSDCSIGSANTYTWSEAVTQCANLDLAGTGWRLPTVLELGQLVDFSKSTAIDTTYFSLSGQPYWSSTVHADQDWAWYVNFINSGISWAMDRTESYAVRCVKD